MKKRRSRPVKRRTLSERMSYQPKGKTGSQGDRRAVAVLSIALAVAIVLVAIALFSPLFWLRDVSVQGAKKIDPDAVAEVARSSSERDFVLLRTSSVVIVNESAVETALLKRFPDIAAVTVTKRWPNSLSIRIEERSGVLNWLTANQYYHLDQEGVAYEKRSETPPPGELLVVDSSNIPVEVGKPVVGKNFITTIRDLRDAFAAKGIKVTRFEVVDTTFEVRAVTDRGFYVLVDATRSPANQVTAAVGALQSAKPGAYLDVRVPGRVYVR